MASVDRIHKSLTKLNSTGYQLDLNLGTDRWIVFSDHHRGIGDGADDFAPCKQNYLTALSHYLEHDYGLIILGDAEEFWENTLKSVISKYKDVLEVENKFHQRNKLIKVWGNHDDAWNHLNKVSQYLSPFFKNIATHEAIRFNVKDDNKDLIGNILLVHGHQGSSTSEQFAGISKWFVRVIWRNIQRWFKIPLSTPSKSKMLKDKHDIAMHTWAKRINKQIVICGHTHQPVFLSKNHLDVLVRQLKDLDHNDVSNVREIKRIKEKIAHLRTKTTAIGTLVTDDKPCYFNSGCCSFSDGDITGLELAESEIRLIKWSDEKRSLIDSEKINDIYAVL